MTTLNLPPSPLPKPGTPLFFDRDLNWLEFNRRVLHEALDERTPLLERVNFLAIFTSNLDEFVMKRVYGLREQIRAGISFSSPSQKAPWELLTTMRSTIQSLLNQQAEVYLNNIRPSLAEQGIHLLAWEDLTKGEKDSAASLFEKTIFPVLTPLSVDLGHPFPFISNLSNSLGLTLPDPQTGKLSFARVKVPRTIPQWIQIDSSGREGVYRFIYLMDLIEHHLEWLFPEMEIVTVMPFRVTRNADVESELEDVVDLLQAVEEQLRHRRMECVVRLELPSNPNPEMRHLLMEELEIGPQDVFEMSGLLDYTSLRSIASLPHSHLRYPPWRPQIPARMRHSERSIFDVIQLGDMLVHHPYESFDETVLRMLKEAVDDPAVLAIKMTIYRTGKDSPFIPLLIRAAESGKQVACLVELKARFDEEENILLAKRMEKAGVHVVYGLEGLKTHTKTTLIVRQEGNENRCYGHIATGNYNHHTAQFYVDLGLMTCQADLTVDLADLFNYLTGRSRKTDYRKLLIAPANMKNRFLEMITREVEHKRAGRPAQIIAKLNQLEDRDVCKALYAASTEGVSIDLIVRGFCILRPQVPVLSENIRVISIIGRFLEHSRIFYFRNGAERDQDGEFYIGSGDWMHRNLEHRVEAVTPIESALLREEIWGILQIHLYDQRSAWDMQSDGSYLQRKPEGKHDSPHRIGSQNYLMNKIGQKINDLPRIDD